MIKLIPRRFLVVNKIVVKKQSSYSTNYSENKLKYISELNGEKPILICTGPTGTGKTYLACEEGINQLNKYKKITYK